MMRTITFVLVAIISTAGSPHLAHSQTDSLLVDFLFSGNAGDSSGNGFDGTVFGPLLTEDRFGTPDEAYFFDGIDDYIGFPVVWNGSSQLTAAAWFYINPASTEGKVLYHGDNGEFQILVDSNFVTGGVHTPTDWQFVSAAVTTNTWHSAVFLWEQSKFAKLYIDGAMVDSVAVPDEPLFDPGPTYQPSVGSYARTLGAYFSGSVDEIRIYERALSADEIRSLYTWSPVGTEESPSQEALSTLDNYPNPFRSSTTIAIDLKSPADVEAVLYNVLGQRVATIHAGTLPVGEQTFRLDTANLPDGFYFCVVRAGEVVRTLKLVKLS